MTAAREGRERFRDDYAALAVGAFPQDYGAHGEYHAILPRGERGGWYEPVWRPGWSDPRWMVLADAGHRELAHAGAPGDPSLLVRETGEWRDPRLEVGARPLSERTRMGLLFAYGDSRRHARLVLGAGLLEIERHDDGRVTCLGRVPFATPVGDSCRLWVEITGDALRAGIEDRALIALAWPDAADGHVGLWADGPARFGPFEVAGDASSDPPGGRAGGGDGATAHPAPNLWRRIPTAGFGTGRQLRFGDLDGDGRLEILAPRYAMLSPDQGVITGLTALDLDGRTRWTWGAPEGPGAMHLCADLPCQVHDLDGDGRAEVVFASGYRLRVLEGATGRELRSMPMPHSPRIPESRRLLARARTRFHEVVLPRLLPRLGLPVPERPWFPWPEDRAWRIRGDAIAFCDVSGAARPTDIAIKPKKSTEVGHCRLPSSSSRGITNMISKSENKLMGIFA